MVLVTALIRDLAARFGGVDVLTSGPWSAPLLLGQPGVGEVLTVRSRKTPYWLSLDQQRAVRRLRARGVGPVWYCDGNDAARLMLARVGIAAEFIVDVKDHPRLPGEHATQQWRRLAKLLPPAMAASGAAAARADGVPPDAAAFARRVRTGGGHVDGGDGGESEHKGNLIHMPGGGSQCPASADSVNARLHFLRMEGKETFKNAVQAMLTAAREALRRCELDITKIKCVIPHQANQRITARWGNGSAPPGAIIRQPGPLRQHVGGLSGHCPG